MSDEIQQVVISEPALAEFQSQVTATATIEDVMARYFGIAVEVSVIENRTVEVEVESMDGEASTLETIEQHVLHVATVTPEMVEKMKEQPSE